MLIYITLDSVSEMLDRIAYSVEMKTELTGPPKVDRPLTAHGVVNLKTIEEFDDFVSRLSEEVFRTRTVSVSYN